MFGLYDTQALAKEIHDRFFVGYAGVTLPHKFKIAVGGCPNNCMKPDLNDLGIVGQRVPKLKPVARGSGRWGKKVRIGTPLSKLFTREEALDVVEKAILLFKSKGETGERFGMTVDRLGAAKVEKMLISDNLLKRKEEILEQETIGGARW